MTGAYTPGRKAREARGWLSANRFLIARRVVQALVFGAFLLGPLAGVWIVKGTLAYSLTLDTLPLTDPLVLVQTILAGHAPESLAIVGGAILAGFYLLVGGRAFCAWVCPVNPITDLANWLRRSLGLTGGIAFARGLRYWILGVVLAVAAFTGAVAWEAVNPVTIVFRGALFGFGAAWAVALAVFALDLVVGSRAWCGHLCPVGAFYSIIGLGSVARVSAAGRDRCDDCLDCYSVCPEPQVITPALKGAADGLGPLILSPNCTNCGRCIDVCPEQVFAFGTRFDDRGRAEAVPDRP